MVDKYGVTFVDSDGRLEPVSDALEGTDIPVSSRCDSVEGIEDQSDCVVVPDAPATDDHDEVNGLALLEAALESVDCPVVVYTRREEDEAVRAPLDVGATDVIRVPPYRPELIARRVSYAAGYGPEFQASCEQVESVFQYYPHSLYIKDDLGRFANVTTHMAHMYGFTRQELIGMSDYELFETDHADRLWEAEQTIVETGEPLVNDIEEYIDEEGERRWVRTTKAPERDENGEIVGLVGGTRDVTPAKQQEALMAALHEASRRLTRATNKSDIAAVAVDIAAEIDHLPAVQLALSTPDGGLDPVETGVGESNVQIFDGFESAFYRARDSGNTQYVDTDGGVSSDASTVVNQVFEGPFETEEVGIVVPLADHGVLGLVAPDGVVDGFTDRLAHVLASNVVAAFDRAERERQLANKNRQLEEFATLGAHELRNRLQIALANVVREGADHDSERLDRAEHTLERMDRLLTQLLRLARTGRIPRTTDTVDLRQAAIRAWEGVDASGDVTLSLPPSSDIVANPDATTEIFEFLFRNSVEHGGGDVTIDVGLLEDGFYVADDGVGIADDLKSELFDVQYADTTHDTGYGLYVVSAIVEAHGWEIAVLDSDGGGARFEITRVERSCA